MDVYFDIFGALIVKGKDNTEHLALGVWADRFSCGDASLNVVREDVAFSDDGSRHPLLKWVTKKIFANDGAANSCKVDGWMTSDKFPTNAGMYEVHGAPQGKRNFYFDGIHWHLHDESQTDLDVRSYGCPGPLWRPASVL